MSTNRKTIITTKFISSLKATVDYIKLDSITNAKKFKEGVDNQIIRINRHPEATSLVKHLPTKRNWYRYKLYKKRYKIIFKVLREQANTLKV